MAKKVTNKVKIEKPTSSVLDRMETEVQANQSRVSLVLGALIVLVVGVLVFNYFSKNKSSAEITPDAMQTENAQSDVTPTNLPGKYTVKEADTLFTIAEKYYQDGYKFSEIAKANNLVSADTIEVGQVLDIPKLETSDVKAAATATPSPMAMETKPDASVAPAPTPTPVPTSIDMGSQISGSTYTVVEGDWLSTIAQRAYGNPQEYEKIAKANNILNPDHIEPGMVLTLPR